MKTAPRSPVLRLAAASLLIFAAACGSAQQPVSPPAPTAASGTGSGAGTAALWQQVQAEAANNSCDNDSQCHSIGVGAKACGGPQGYMAWSSKQTDGARLKNLVERHAAARRADDEREHMLSTCSMVSDPGAVCRANRCQLNASPSAAPGAQ